MMMTQVQALLSHLSRHPRPLPLHPPVGPTAHQPCQASMPRVAEAPPPTHSLVHRLKQLVCEFGLAQVVLAQVLAQVLLQRP